MSGRANVGNKRGRGRAICTIEGCERIVKGRHLCEKHYMRAYRHEGDTAAGAGRYGNGSLASTGYIETRRKGHPLARAHNHVLMHRVVLFDKIGPGPHPCHWCQKPVDWEVGLSETALIVDHVDWDRANNDPDNLVPSCHRCNTGRRKPRA